MTKHPLTVIFQSLLLLAVGFSQAAQDSAQVSSAPAQQADAPRALELTEETTDDTVLPGDDEIMVVDPPGEDSDDADTLPALELEEEVVADSSSTLPTDEDIVLTDGGDPKAASDTVVDSLPPIETMPTVLEFVEAEYPAELHRKGIEGTVLLDVLVSDSGTVDSVAVVRSLHPVLDSSAADALRRFSFSPAIAGGEPVPVLLQYEYRFSLIEVVEELEKYVNFEGRLLERGTRKPIADAMVVINFVDTVSDTSLPVPFSTYRERIGRFEEQYLEEDRLVTLTDSLGYFRFYSLPTCTIEVTAPLPGYEQFLEQEAITSGEKLQATYFVQRVSYSDYEIVVYGKTEKKEVSRHQLSINEVKKIPGFGGDAVKVVQALPGVARPTFGSGQVIVRGARTWDSEFLLDGVTIPQLYHFGGVKSTYNSDALSSVDLYPGGFGTRYGNAIGGVVEITGRAGDSERYHGKADASFLDASFLAEGPVGSKVSVLASARRSYVGDLLAFAVDNIPMIDLPITVAPFYWDYVLRTDADFNDNHDAFLTLFGAKDGLELIVPGIRGGSPIVDDAVDRIKQEIMFNMALIGWNWDSGDRFSNLLRYAVTRAHTASSIFGIARWNADMWMHQVRDELGVGLHPALELKLGADMQFIPYEQESVFPVRSNEFLFDTLEATYGLVGGYLNGEWKPIEQLLIMPGIRYDYYLELDHNGGVVPEFWEYHSFDNDGGISAEPSARLTTRWEIIEGHTAKFSVGNYNQTPQPQGLSTHETFGNPNLPTTKAAHYVGGYEWQITDLLFTDVQLYWNRQWDIPEFETETDLTGEDFSFSETQRFYPEGRGRMRGLELLIRHDQGERFFGWLAYTLARSERYDRAKDRFVLFGQDQTHNLQLVGSWRLPEDWEAGCRVRFVSGNPYTPIIGSYFDARNRAYVGVPGKENSARNDPFFQVDARIDKKFIFDRFIMSLYVDIQNLSWFFYKSPEFLISNYNPYDIKEQQEDRQPIAYPFVPSVGVSAEF